MGKYRKAPFPARDSSTTGILDLVHTDVSGRMSHVSLRGYEYYVLFIDDFPRKSWIFFLKAKGEVFKCFKEFKALVENQTGKRLKYRGQTTEVSILIVSLLTFVLVRASRESSPFHTLHSKMEWLNGRTELS